MKSHILATELEIRDSVKQLREALEHNVSHGPNVWTFFSNKNQALITLLGDVTFIQSILLEGDPTVSSYYSFADIDSDSCVVGKSIPGRELHVRRTDGTEQWILCIRSKHQPSSAEISQEQRYAEREKAAQAQGASFEIKSERDFSDRMIEFGNCLTLCCAMTRANDFTCFREAEMLSTSLLTKKALLIRDLLALNGCDRALMLAAIGHGIANGSVHCDLSTRPLTINTMIARSDKTIPKISRSVGGATTLTASHKIEELVPKNRRTSVIPEMWSDLLKWPHPISNLMANSEIYHQRERAVRMYILNSSYEEIVKETGIGQSWVRKLFYRCLQPAPDGAIYGFRALVKNCHIVGYNRVAEPPNGFPDATKKPGYAGAFTQLLERYSNELPSLIESHVLRVRGKGHKSIPVVKVKWVTLKNEIHDFLRKNGVGENDYPFNTADKGYNAIANICRSILFKKPIPWITARCGKEAGKRAQIGNGVPSIIQATGPYQILELDFHKHDTAAIVEIETPNGEMIDALVPRWWIGALVDTYDRAIISSSDSFEPQTTEACVLELLDSAIQPPAPLEEERRFSVNSDGNWLPNQIYPELAFHGWNILKLDRAWAHKSTNVISSLIATVGCAICFGRVREWWCRALVERTFGQLTQMGAQQLPSTFGTGPKDSLRQDPDLQAIRYRFRQSDICDFAKSNVRWANEDGKEGNFYVKPLVFLKHVVDGQCANYIPAPLPLARKNDRPLMWITIRCRVEGNPHSGIAPHVRTRRCRFRGIELARAWHLIGKTVFLQIYRHDIRKARIVIEKTGEILGEVLPDHRWLSLAVSWRNFCMIQKHGLQQRLDGRPKEPVLEFLSRAAAELASQKKQKPSKSNRRRANLHASITRDIKYYQKNEGGTINDKTINDNGTEKTTISDAGPDMFGDIPDIKSFFRRG